MIVVIVLGIYWISRQAKALTPTEYTTSDEYATIEEMGAVLARARNTCISSDHASNCTFYEEIAPANSAELENFDGIASTGEGTY